MAHKTWILLCLVILVVLVLAPRQQQEAEAFAEEDCECKWIQPKSVVDKRPKCEIRPGQVKAPSPADKDLYECPNQQWGPRSECKPTYPTLEVAPELKRDGCQTCNTELPMFVDVDVAKSTWAPNNGFKYACKGGFVSNLTSDTVVCDKLSGRWMLGAAELTQAVCSVKNNKGIYVVGNYSSASATASSSTESGPSKQLPTSASNDAFVVKYDFSGNVQWATRVGGTSSDNGYGIATDKDGNVYVTGNYSGSNATAYSVSPGANKPLPTSTTIDVFIIKYNSDGIAQWATRIGGTATDYGYGIATDKDGYVYVTGYYSSSSTATATAYSVSPGANKPLPSPAGALTIDVFVVKYNSDGNAQWATRIGGTSFDYGHGIATDKNGFVYITGYYFGSTAIAYSVSGVHKDLPPSTSSSKNSTNDAFVVKYNSDGNAQWATNIGGASDDRGYGIATDNVGNVYVTGSYSGSATAYSVSPGASKPLPVSSLDDVFIVKYNSDGNALWATNIGGTSTDNGNGIATDNVGNVYVTGSYSGSATAYSVSPGAPKSLSASSSDDVFIVKYNSDGNAQWATNIGGTSTDNGNGIATDKDGNVYVTGYCYGSGTATAYSVSPGSHKNLSSVYHSFIVKYSSNGIVESACVITDSMTRGIAA